MTRALQEKWLYGGLGLFIALSALFLYFEVFWLVALPIALAIVYIALFRLHWLFLLITFCTPLSIGLDDVGGGLGLAVPTEPLIFGAMLVFLIRQFYEQKYDLRILKHPLSMAILLNLMWLLISALLSELPVVSFKFLLARAWFVLVFFYFGVRVVRYPDLLNKYIWLYAIPMAFVIIYTISRQAARAFDELAAHWVMQPFFKDHTIYGAILAFYIPILLAYLFYNKYDINTKILAGFFFSVFIVGVVASYTRAAWVSLVAGLMLFLVIRFRVRWWILGLVFITGLTLFFSFQMQIMQKLEKNRQDSSGDLAEHVQSISNVATDASNLERLNRWNCAFRMFFESPVAGKGPGTYSFLYAPYQHSADLTIISTNFGDLGNAHSEYFGPLAETGVPGLVTFLLIIFFLYYRSIPLYYQLKDREQAKLLMGVLIGLTTYLVHGMLNNFLDQDKAAIPFWGFLAIIVAMDVYGEKTIESPDKPTTPVSE